MALVTATAGLIRGISRVWRHKIGYTFATLTVFALSVYSLAALDLLPEKASVVKATPAAVVLATATPEVTELPLLVHIPSLNMKVTVSNPDTTNVAKLDEALLTGAVRYPTSAQAGADGNMIIFGHSSYLPVVHNQSFKAFNNIQKLAHGDKILVSGATHTYVYEVDNVRQADAGSDAIPLTVDGKMLTLATCDSFGKPTDRFIVTAHFVESYPNAS